MILRHFENREGLGEVYGLIRHNATQSVRPSQKDGTAGTVKKKRFVARSTSKMKPPLQGRKDFRAKISSYIGVQFFRYESAQIQINLVLKDFLYKRRLPTTQFFGDVSLFYLFKSIYEDSHRCSFYIFSFPPMKHFSCLFTICAVVNLNKIKQR